MSTELEIIVKASAVLGLAALVHVALGRRASAATRHLVWTIAICAVIVLPILSFALPAWAVVVRTAPMTTPNASLGVDAVRESADDAAPSSVAARLASAAVPAPAA